MFNTINSLIVVKACHFQFCPTNFAGALPKNLPTTATKIMAPVTFHKYGSLISQFLKPVNTKKTGATKVTATSSTFLSSRFRNIRHNRTHHKAPKGHEYQLLL
jgi:hypothetical protein